MPRMQVKNKKKIKKYKILLDPCNILAWAWRDSEIPRRPTKRIVVLVEM
jgi:hypothetical protein